MPEPPFEGDWLEEESELPPGGPRRWWRRISDGSVAIGGPPRRVATELVGLQAEHPARPGVLDRTEEWIHFEALGPAPQDPLKAVGAWPATSCVREGPLYTLLPPCAVQIRKSLRRIGCRRIDRSLDRPARLEVLEGPSFGGIHGAWLREAGDRVVALRWSRYAEEGRPDLDRAATAWQIGDFAAGPALLPHLLEEAVLGKDDEARAAALELFADLARPEPLRVEVTVVGAPLWLDTAQWSGSMRPRDARRVMHQLEGMCVSGHTLHVRCEPPIRKGSAPTRCEPRSTRRRRLFSRWFQGVQTDEQGLVSLTPEALAEDFVAGLSGRVIDGTCGVGALAIAAARNPEVEAVLAVDTDMGRLRMAAHNAGLYGATLGLRHGSALDVLWEPHDALLLDPPWGGRDYDRKGMGLADLDFPLAEVLERTSAHVRVKLPRSFRVSELPGGPWRFRAAVDGRGIFKFVVAER